MLLYEMKKSDQLQNETPHCILKKMIAKRKRCLQLRFPNHILKGPEINLDQTWWCCEMQEIYPKTIALVQPICFPPIKAAVVFAIVSLLL